MKNFNEKWPYLVGALIAAAIVFVFFVFGIFGDAEMGTAFRTSPLWMKIVGLILLALGGFVFYKASRDEAVFAQNDNTNMFIITAILFLAAVFGLLFLLGFYAGVL